MKNLHSYFDPVNSELYTNKSRWETTQIGRLIETHIDGFFPDLKSTQIAIFNVPEYDGSRNSVAKSDCKIRALFYSFHHHKFPGVADLGILNLMSNRKTTFEKIQIVCKELLHNGIVPCIIVCIF